MGNTINIYYHRRANKYLNKLGKNEKTKLMVLINSKIQDFIKKKDRRYIYQEKYFSKLVYHFKKYFSIELGKIYKKILLVIIFVQLRNINFLFHSSAYYEI